jgi:phage major head subunit gpT-like protein
MSVHALTSRGIIGRFYQTLESGPVAWVNDLTFTIDSDQETESIKWLGMTPQMQKWVGGRDVKGQRTQGFDITNEPYQATLEVDVRDLRRDKTGQIMVRIDELADRANSFKAKLLTERILLGESTVCYDGQYFFDTDHSEGESGSQSNDISVDISALPVSTHGSTTAPSSAEVAHMIARAIEGMLTLKDDQGEPLNEEARDFLVQVPVPYLSATAMALSGQPLEQGDTSVIGTMDGFTVRARANPRLTWTDRLAVFRTDGRVKPFILQEELPISLDAIAEGSELEFTHKKHHYGVEWEGAVAFGMWQHACLVTAV